jgi:hypothetical protein
MANLKLATSNQSPRTHERAALADTLARRDAAVREIQAAPAAEEKAREHRYDAECKLERAKAVNAHALDVSAFVRAVDADDICEQVKAVAVSSADIRQLEQDYERWQLMEAATHERVRELENAALHIPVQSKVEAVIRAEADVSALLDGFESLRAELDRRLSVLTWLHCGGLVGDDDLQAVKDAIASCYQFTRDEGAVRDWREAVAALASDADTQLPGAK